MNLSSLSQIILLSEYNQLMNQRQYLAAAKLSEADLCKDMGAFFKSVLGTFNHIMVGDIVWLKRFAVHPSSSKALSYILELEKPKALDSILFAGLEELRAEREKIDQVIIEWSRKLTDNDMNDCISYSNMAGKLFSKPYASLINHLFQHQTHHRGQATTLLSQLGVGFGETDLIEIIDECSA